MDDCKAICIKDHQSSVGMYITKGEIVTIITPPNGVCTVLRRKFGGDVRTSWSMSTWETDYYRKLGPLGEILYD